MREEERIEKGKCNFYGNHDISILYLLRSIYDKIYLFVYLI